MGQSYVLKRSYCQICGETTISSENCIIPFGTTEKGFSMGMFTITWVFLGVNHRG